MNKTLIILILTLIGYSNLYACSCKKEKSVRGSYEYQHIESIVHGKVLSKTMVSVASTMDKVKLDSLKKTYSKQHEKLKRLYYKGILKVKIEIIKEFKGKPDSNTVTIFTHSQSSACGYTKFIVGKEYLIYGSSRSMEYSSFQKRGKRINYELENTFWTYHCLRTKEYQESEAQELSSLMN